MMAAAYAANLPLDVAAPPASAISNPLQSPPPILQSIDWFVAAAGVLAAAVFAFRCMGTRDPVIRLEAVPQRPNRFGEDSVLIAVLAYLVTAAVFAAVLQPSAPAAAVWKIMAVDTAARIAGVIASVVLARRQFAGGAADFVLGRPKVPPANLGLLTVGAGLVTLGVCPLIQDCTIWIVQQVLGLGFTPKPHPTLERLEAGQAAIWVVWLWVSAAVVAPVAEEVFFRGVLQSALGNVVRDRRLAVLLASVAFGAVHFSQPQAVVPLIAMGLVLGYVYERTASLSVPIAVHVLFNLKTLVWHQLSYA